MASDDLLAKPNIKVAMDELMKSEEGRELASKLRNKLKELNDQFTGLSGEEKKKFLGEFREKFADSLGEIKDSFKTLDDASGQFKLRGDESDSVPTPVSITNYFPLLFAILVLAVVFG